MWPVSDNGALQPRDGRKRIVTVETVSEVILPVEKALPLPLHIFFLKICLSAIPPTPLRLHRLSLFVGEEVVSSDCGDQYRARVPPAGGPQGRVTS